MGAICNKASSRSEFPMSREKWKLLWQRALIPSASARLSNGYYLRRKRAHRDSEHLVRIAGKIFWSTDWLLTWQHSSAAVLQQRGNREARQPSTTGQGTMVNISSFFPVPSGAAGTYLSPYTDTFQLTHCASVIFTQGVSTCRASELFVCITQ